MVTTTPTAPNARPGPSTTSTNLSSEEWQRELLALNDARTAYEERFGWPVRVEAGQRRVTVATGTMLDAVTMPAALADAVVHGLISIMEPAAVLDTGGDGRWQTILTDPRPANSTLPADLERAKVRFLPQGTPLVLPVPGRWSRDVQWKVPPRPGRALPDHSVVITLARRASQAGSV